MNLFASMYKTHSKKLTKVTAGISLSSLITILGLIATYWDKVDPSSRILLSTCLLECLLLILLTTILYLSSKEFDSLQNQLTKMTKESKALPFCGLNWRKENGLVTPYCPACNTYVSFKITHAHPLAKDQYYCPKCKESVDLMLSYMDMTSAIKEIKF